MDIIGFEGLYKIYDDGRVLSVRRNKFLKQGIDRGGYYLVALCNKGKTKWPRVHTLVATHYIGERPPNLQTDHIDRDKSNNNLSNLRYISRSDNQKNKYVTGKVPYRHIGVKGNGFEIRIKKNYKVIFYKCSRRWTLEEAVKVRNEAYIKLGIEIDDAIRN
jgi:hypothetical protein